MANWRRRPRRLRIAQRHLQIGLLDEQRRPVSSPVRPLSSIAWSDVFRAPRPAGPPGREPGREAQGRAARTRAGNGVPRTVRCPARAAQRPGLDRPTPTRRRRRAHGPALSRLGIRAPRRPSAPRRHPSDGFHAPVPEVENGVYETRSRQVNRGGRCAPPARAPPRRGDQPSLDMTPSRPERRPEEGRAQISAAFHRGRLDGRRARQDRRISGSST